MDCTTRRIFYIACVALLFMFMFFLCFASFPKSNCSRTLKLALSISGYQEKEPPIS